MKTERKSAGNGVLIAVLSFLVVAIVGLTISLVVMSFARGDITKGYVRYNDEYSVSPFLLERSRTIVDKYDNDSNYSVDDAKRDFEKLLDIDGMTNRERLDVSYQYARFLVERLNDLESAIGVMNNVENTATDYNMKLQYNVYVRELYGLADDNDQYAYYDYLVQSLMIEQMEETANENN